MSAAADFFKWREDWLKFVTIPNAHGSYDVAIVIDGGYGLPDALRNAQDYERKVAAACKADGLPLGVPTNRLTMRLGIAPAPAEELE